MAELQQNNHSTSVAHVGIMKNVFYLFIWNTWHAVILCTNRNEQYCKHIARIV